MNPFFHIGHSRGSPVLTLKPRLTFVIAEPVELEGRSLIDLESGDQAGDAVLGGGLDVNIFTTMT